LRVTEDVFPVEERNNNSSIPSVLAFIIPISLRQRWTQSIPWMKWPHVKFLHICWILLIFDLSTLYFCTSQLLAHGPSVYIYFGFEGAILLCSALSTITLFEMHIVDGLMTIIQRFHTEAEDDVDSTPTRNNHPHQELSTLQRISQRITCTWRDNRATLSISVELLAQAAKFLFSLTLFGTVLTYYGLPFSILREVYFSYQKLRERLTSFASYRRLTRNMNERFESVESDSELESAGRTCIICRDHMDVHGVLGGCKKLPICGHIFHKHCLREWLIQQQTCPTCRGDIQTNELKAKALLRLSRGQAENSAQMHESNQESRKVETSIDKDERITESQDRASSIRFGDNDGSDECKSTEKNAFPGLYRIVDPCASIVMFEMCKENSVCMRKIKSLKLSATISNKQIVKALHSTIS
jgi:E3 ubiquitin-protein ligase synoviolin